MKAIERDELKQMIDSDLDVKVVEVLGPESYDQFHLPGAINVPVGKDFEERIQQAVPDKSKPVVVYCKDTDCEASPSAAHAMDRLGYEEVYDYEAGKEDWKAAGLPVES